MTVPKHLVISGMENRSFTMTELRAGGDDSQSMRIEGYAAVFNSLSEDLGGFRERIQQGAFAKTIEEADVRALLNHDANYVMGRSKSGTLQMTEDEHGLKVSIDLPDAQWARDLMVSVRRGDVDQMSFQFRTLRDRWLEEGGLIVRVLIEVRLYDVSVVTFPAYPATTAQARSALGEVGIEYGPLVMSITRMREGSSEPDDRSRIENAIRSLQSLLTAAPGQVAHPVESDATPPHVQVLMELRRRQLDLAERS